LAVALGLVVTAPAAQPAAQKDTKLSPKDLQKLWEDLASEDAAKAYRTIFAFVNSPKESVPFFKQRLKPVVAPGPGVLDRLIADLGSPDAAEHDKAMKELEKWRELAVPALERALREKPAPRLRQQCLETLLERAAGLTLSAEELRTWRALQSLERIGTPEARQVLEALAKGAPGAWLTEESKAALQRLANVKAGAP